MRLMVMFGTRTVAFIARLIASLLFSLRALAGAAEGKRDSRLKTAGMTVGERVAGMTVGEMVAGTIPSLMVTTTVTAVVAQ
ncbi:MAG: hypothetical protein ACR2P7_09820 [bacterium]